MKERRIFTFAERPAEKDRPELCWAGKRLYCSTRYYPAQCREVYGKAQDGWRNRLYWGDNLQVMSHLLEEFRGRVDLVYIDPPFDSRADYKKMIELRGVGESAVSFTEKQYGDRWTDGEYLQFMYERLILIRELLSERGSVYLHCDWHRAAHLKLLMDEVFGAGHFLNEIVWCYQGTGKTVTQYKRKHDTLLFYAKTDCWTFNARAVGTPFGEKQRKKFSGRDERGAYKEYRHADGRVYRKYWQEDDFLPCNDWWSDIFVIQDHGERVGYPTQKPEALLNRIITASSRPGDLVFDCFMGSGTAQAAAMKLGRRFLGADSSLGAVQTAVKRLLAAGEGLEAEEGTWYTGFAVYTVGDPVQKGEKGAADIVCEGGRLVVRRFYPARLMRELALRGACPEDWRRLVDSIMIDWNYDGTVLRPSVTDIPRKNEMVSGSYRIPETTGVIRVKITDLLSESLEIEVC